MKKFLLVLFRDYVCNVWIFCHGQQTQIRKDERLGKQ